MLGESPTAEVVPVPVKLTFCMLPGTLPLSSVTTSVALRLPAAAGLKVTLIEQLALAASVLPQVLADSAKSEALAPVTPRLAMFKVAFPVLFKMTAKGALVVVTGWFPKAKLLGERPATAAALVPVPVRLMICWLSLALSATITEAVRVPAELGVNVTVMAQLLPAATEALQVVVSEKSPGLAPAKAILEMLSPALPVLARVTD